MKQELFYIQNAGYSGNALFWWALDKRGYTTDIRKAHKFTKQEAKSIINRPEDTAWPCQYIDNLLEAQKLIIDMQYVDHQKSTTEANDFNCDIPSTISESDYTCYNQTQSNKGRCPEWCKNENYCKRTAVCPSFKAGEINTAICQTCLHVKARHNKAD